MIKIGVDRLDKIDFKLLAKIEYLIEYVDIYVFSSFPRHERGIRDILSNALYDLLNNCSLANFNNGSIRTKYQKAMLSNIVSIDFCFGFILDKKIITLKRFYTLVSILNEVKTMTYGWIDGK